jgi:predicted nucleic acid-binding protein
VAIVYLDTSAVGRVLLAEPDASAVLHALQSFEQRVASRLLRVELRRLALRESLIPEADQLVLGVALLPLDDAVLAAAETVAPSAVGTLDSIHLVTALRLAAGNSLDALMTYDPRLAEGARLHGIPVLSPS